MLNNGTSRAILGILEVSSAIYLAATSITYYLKYEHAKVLIDKLTLLTELQDLSIKTHKMVIDGLEKKLNKEETE